MTTYNIGVKTYRYISVIVIFLTVTSLLGVLLVKTLQLQNQSLLEQLLETNYRKDVTRYRSYQEIADMPYELRKQYHELQTMKKRFVESCKKYGSHLC